MKTRKKLFAASMAVVLSCSGTVITASAQEAPTQNKELIPTGIPAAPPNTAMIREEEASPVQSIAEENLVDQSQLVFYDEEMPETAMPEISEDRKIVEPEIAFENTYHANYAMTEFNNEEAAQAREERKMDQKTLGYDADSIIVTYDAKSINSKWNDSDDLTELCRSQVIQNGDDGARELIGSHTYKLVLIDLNDNKTVETALEEYKNMDGVISAEPNYIVEINSCTAESNDSAGESEESKEQLPSLKNLAGVSRAAGYVNDTDRSKQWYLDRINAQAAWDFVQSVPHSKVKVCVLDTGCYLNHSDLNINRADSKEIISSSNGTDELPLLGDDYYRGNKRTDDNGHGTAVTGIIGATANNSYGIAGVASCYNNDILDIFVVDVFDGMGDSPINTIIDSLYYAQRKGARVINMSFSLFEGFKFKKLTDTCNLLKDNGIVLVASAGNECADTYVEPSDIESVISVMSTDQSNNKASDSGYGEYKDICAPGAGIYSTSDPTSIVNREYATWYGTSFAAPLVTGTVAMMLSVNPGLNSDAIKSLLYTTATDLGATGKDYTYANGLLNSGRAVRASSVKIDGIYPISNENSITLGCVHVGGCNLTKYRWEYCVVGQSQWHLISDWNSSEWCTWYPDANENYVVVCRASYLGNKETTRRVDWTVSCPQMTASINGTCVNPTDNGILVGCTANTDKYYTSIYIYSYATNTWVDSACSKGSSCWYRANALPKGTYMAFFCTEETAHGRKLSTAEAFNFVVQ